MITSEFVCTMARYNCWQNQSIYGACDTLSGKERELDRGAFFGSIQETLSHLLWGDMMWMNRFTDSEPPEVTSIPESKSMIQDWGKLKQARTDVDRRILDWSKQVDDETIAGDLTWYSGAMKCDVTKPYSFLVTHFFNHQTHHRGQVHAMITAAGGKPDDTDLFFMPEDVKLKTL